MMLYLSCERTFGSQCSEELDGDNLYRFMIRGYDSKQTLAYMSIKINASCELLVLPTTSRLRMLCFLVSWPESKAKVSPSLH